MCVLFGERTPLLLRFSEALIAPQEAQIQLSDFVHGHREAPGEGRDLMLTS